MSDSVASRTRESKNAVGMNGVSRGRNFIDQVVQVTVQMKKSPITPRDRCQSRTKSNVVGCENTERIGRNKKYIMISAVRGKMRRELDEMGITSYLSIGFTSFFPISVAYSCRFI